MRHRLSRSADRDLVKIYRGSIVRFGVAHADRYLDGLEASFAHIGQMPQMAPMRDDLGGVRVLRYMSHHIYYRVLKDEVLIVRVLHGRQDSKRHL